MNSWAKLAVFYGIITYHNGVMRHQDLNKRERATMVALAKSTGYVRRMRDGRWEVTAKGWQHHNFTEQQRQAYRAGLIDEAGQDTTRW